MPNRYARASLSRTTYHCICRIQPDGMTRAPTLALVDLLCSTLKQVEQMAKLSPDDPALRELKRRILRVITELDVQKSRAG